MHSKIIKQIIAILIIGFSCLSMAQNYSKTETTYRCNVLGNEIGAAINASDFSNLKNVIAWGIANCKNYIDRDDYYELYANLSIAERELGNPTAALKAADECIKNRYGLPICHIERFATYNAIGNIQQSLSSAKIAKAILLESVKAKKRELLTPSLKYYEKEAIQAKLDSYDAMLEFVNNFLVNK